MEKKLTDIARLRLRSQHLGESSVSSPEALVSHFGAMQAQDYAMAKWAVGCRLAEATERSVQDAINDGRILRTHVLRPTWHFVAADDIRWMLDLTADRIRATMKARAREFGITADVLSKNVKILEKVLADGPLTRDKLMEAYAAHNVATGNYRGGHLLAYAELEALICSGPDSEGKPTYALLDQRVKGKSKSYAPEEAAVLLAGRYFKSHGPATEADFSWWSGLSLTQARKAIPEVAGLERVEVGGKTYFVPEGLSPTRKKSTLLLPAFDEFLISYTDRSASMEAAYHKKAISINGIFSPILVIDGQVAGTWKRAIKKDTVSIDLHPFGTLSDPERSAVEKEKKRFAAFLGKKPA